MPTEQSEPVDADALATQMVAHLADRWMRCRLPVAPLAAAMAAWGLGTAAHVEGPEETAEGLERIAAAIREMGVGDDDPVH